ncbi:MAG: Trm112 family protein [Planctomycetes bacterium]|nr:Trm112 family protein [Planctomycetota bacterium]
MSLSASLLECLVCPLSRGPLELVDAAQGNPRLYSKEVGVYFPVQSPDIPVLLADKAQAEDGSSAESLIAEWRERARIIEGSQHA